MNEAQKPPPLRPFVGEEGAQPAVLERIRPAVRELPGKCARQQLVAMGRAGVHAGRPAAGGLPLELPQGGGAARAPVAVRPRPPPGGNGRAPFLRREERRPVASPSCRRYDALRLRGFEIEELPAKRPLLSIQQ
jgi:hypothetical protein